MELCHGRDLVDYVLNHPPGGIATSSCRRLMQQLLLGVHFLHSYNVRLHCIYLKPSDPNNYHVSAAVVNCSCGALRRMR